MASLGEIIEKMNVKQPSSKITLSNNRLDEKKEIGIKRRAWLENSENDENIDNKNGVYKPLNNNVPINPLNKPLISTPSMNPIYAPLNNKGLIYGANKPLIVSLQNLRGNPLTLVLFIFKLVNDESDKKTKKITISDIIKNLQISKDSARTALRFLLKNFFLTRTNLKVGKNGWSQYAMSETLYNEIDEAIKKGAIKPFSMKDNLVKHKGSNSSGSNIYKTTTTDGTEILKNELPSEEGVGSIEIDIEPLKEINFTKQHLNQILSQKKLSAEDIRSSINAFAFDLKENNKRQKITGEPVSFFMGILRKGIVYLPPANYESPEDKFMREYTEQKKALAKMRAEREEEAISYAFSDWDQSTPMEEKRQISPHFSSGDGFMEVLKDFFRKNIWPSKKTEILKIREVEEINGS